MGTKRIRCQFWNDNKERIAGAPGDCKASSCGYAHPWDRDGIWLRAERRDMWKPCLTQPSGVEWGDRDEAPASSLSSMKHIKCMFYDDQGLPVAYRPRCIGGPGQACHFAHPDEKEWASAMRKNKVADERRDKYDLEGNPLSANKRKQISTPPVAFHLPRRSRCKYYDDDGQPIPHRRRCEGSEDSAEFAHPTDPDWDVAVRLCTAQPWPEKYEWDGEEKEEPDRNFVRCQYFDDDGERIPYTKLCHDNCEFSHPRDDYWDLATRKSMAPQRPDLFDEDGTRIAKGHAYPKANGNRGARFGNRPEDVYHEADGNKYYYAPALTKCMWYGDDGKQVPHTPGCYDECPYVHPDSPAWASAVRTRLATEAGLGNATGPRGVRRRCRFFDDKGARVLYAPPCHREKCGYVHPDEPDWDSAARTEVAQERPEEYTREGRRLGAPMRRNPNTGLAEDNTNIAGSPTRVQGRGQSDGQRRASASSQGEGNSSNPIPRAAGATSNWGTGEASASSSNFNDWGVPNDSVDWGGGANAWGSDEKSIYQGGVASSPADGGASAASAGGIKGQGKLPDVKHEKKPFANPSSSSIPSTRQSSNTAIEPMPLPDGSASLSNAFHKDNDAMQVDDVGDKEKEGGGMHTERETGPLAGDIHEEDQEESEPPRSPSPMVEDFDEPLDMTDQSVVHERRTTHLLHIVRLRHEREGLIKKKAHWEAEKHHPAEVLADFSGKDRDIMTRDSAFERRKRWLDQEIAAREAAMLKLPESTGPSLDFDAACENLDLVRKYVEDARKWLGDVGKQTEELGKLQDGAKQEMLDPGSSGKIAPLKMRTLPEELSMKLILRHLEAYETKIGEIQNFVEELASDPEEMFEQVDERCEALERLSRRLEGELQERPEEKRVDEMERACASVRGTLEQVKQKIAIAEANVEEAKARREESLKIKALVMERLAKLESEALERPRLVKQAQAQMQALYELANPPPQKLLASLMDALLEKEVEKMRPAIEEFEEHLRSAVRLSRGQIETRIEAMLRPALQQTTAIRTVASEARNGSDAAVVV